MKKLIVNWKNALGALGYRPLWNRFRVNQSGKRRAGKRRSASQTQYGALEPRQLLAAVSYDSSVAISGWYRDGELVVNGAEPSLPTESDRPDLLNVIQVEFSEDYQVDPAALQIFNDTLGGEAVPLEDAEFDYDPQSFTATWDLSGIPEELDAGYYSFSLDNQLVTDDSGASIDYEASLDQQTYVALPGDANLDGQVDVLWDGSALVANLGVESGATWAQGDFNGDGRVDVLGDAVPLIVNILDQSLPEVSAARRGAFVSYDSSVAIAGWYRDGELVVNGAQPYLPTESVRPDLVNVIQVEFREGYQVDPAALRIFNDTLGGQAVSLEGVEFSYDAESSTATWDLSGIPQALTAGYYSFSLDNQLVTDDSGVPIAYESSLDQQTYVALLGDANLDGQVDVLGDALALVTNLGLESGATWAQGDFNGDGRVNVLGDALALVGNLNQSLPEVPPTRSGVSVSYDSSIAIAGWYRDGELFVNGAQPSLPTESDRPDLLNVIQVQFREGYQVDPAALRIFNDTLGGEAVSLEGVEFSYDAENFTATWDLSGIPEALTAGYYTFSLDNQFVIDDSFRRPDCL